MHITVDKNFIGYQKKLYPPERLDRFVVVVHVFYLTPVS
jgi:hypothetical protein